MSPTLEVLGFGLGASELLIILAILTLIFGASRIPDLGKSLGSGIRGFQKSLRGDDEDEQPKLLSNESQGASSAPARAEAPPAAVAAAPTAAPTAAPPATADAEAKS